MALAKQYYSSYTSYNGWEYYLEVWVEGFDGTPAELTLGKGGPVITYGTDEQDRFSPILSSKLELPFMVTNVSEDQFIKNIREQYNEQDVYIHLYRANSTDYSSVSPLWSGFVLMDLSASPDLYYPYPVTLTAVDGLALLKEIEFVKSGTFGSYTDSDMYSDNGRFTYWIKEILLKSGASTTDDGSTEDYKFTTAINWFNSVMPTITQSTDPFYQTKCNTKMFYSKDADGNFTVINCYNVLKNLLKHWGARIIYWKHIYYIVQIQEYNTTEGGTFVNPDNIDTRTYTKAGTFDSSADNLGDSYWTRYQLLIDNGTGGIQKIAGSKFNYLPQVKRTQANFIDYGGKNYFGGLPFKIATAQTDIIYQDTISDMSSDDSMLILIPLDITIVDPDLINNGIPKMRLQFNMFVDNGVTRYYLKYDPVNTPKFYWELSTATNLYHNRVAWTSDLDYIIGTQTKTGFHQQIEFKDKSGSGITLAGDWDVYIALFNWGNAGGSFRLNNYYGGPLYEPSSSTIYWTNTLNPTYSSSLGQPSTIGTTTIGNNNNPALQNIIDFTPSFNINPFIGQLLIVNSTPGSVYGSQISEFTGSNDVEIVNFGDLIWGDTLLASSEGSLKVWNGSSFVKSAASGTWGLGTLSGAYSFTEMLLKEYLWGQTKVVESPSMTLVISETNKNETDGSGSRPNYINPIGRLRGYSATGTTPYYIFKSGSFHLLKDEVEYQGYQIIRNVVSTTSTDDIIIGANILQDNTNKVGPKIPEGNTLFNNVTQNSIIATVSATKSAFGSDIAVNGLFASDTGWTKGTGWTIADDKASFAATGSTSDLKQDILTDALTYKIGVSVVVSTAGLNIKAGSSGNSTLISATGVYEVFSTCSGSTDIIFEASAAFEGYIDSVIVTQQVPVTAITINAIGTALLKTNDVINIAGINGGDITEFTLTSNQGASDTSVAVSSTLITEDILVGSIVLVNQDDLVAQYQNKTKGTVAGFGIDADGIEKGGVEITAWLDSDTMSGATANNVPTAESVKAYVDAQVGSADTLQEVTDNGNTTTNDVTLDKNSGASPSIKFVNGSDDNGGISINSSGKIQIQTGGTVRQTISSGDTEFNGDIKIVNGSGNVTFESSTSGDLTVTSGDDIRLDAGGNDITLRSSGTEFGRLTRNSGLQITSSETNANINLIPNGTGNVGIGLTNAATELEVIGDIRATDSSSRSITLNTGGSNQVIETTGGLNLSAGDGTVRATMYGVNTELKIDDTLQATKIILKSSGASYFNGGNVLISTTVDSGSYNLDVNGKARVQDVLELDDVLTLNAISTPSNPATNKSSIYMDSADGNIKVLINVGGVTVSRTIASFEE